MGLFSFLGGLLGGSSAKKASRRAEEAQLGYLGQALGEERRQFDVTRGDFAPWRTEGGAAIAQIGDILGLHGNDAQQGQLSALLASPYYQSLYRNGLETNLQNASATGGIRGGDEVRGLADFGADTFAQTIQQQLANLGNVSGLGLQATSGTAASGDNLTQAIANILGQQGQVRAGGILTRGGITNGMWQNAGGFLDQALQAALSAGMGPGGAPFNLGAFASKAF